MKFGLRPAVAVFLVLMSVALPLGADSPRRIVSLDLCSDWMLLTYVERNRISAFSPYLKQFETDWVEPGLPSHDGSLEQVLALKPDLIVTGEYNALLLRERLRQLGQRVEVLPNPARLDDIAAYIQQVKSLVEKDMPDAAVPESLPQKRPSWHERLLLLGANGIGIGRDTLEHDVITAAGWRNYVEDDGFVALQLEKIIVDPPDAVFISSSRGNSLADRFSNHPALQQRIINTRWKTDDGWRWTCPGPWTYRLIEDLSAWHVR